VDADTMGGTTRGLEAVMDDRDGRELDTGSPHPARRYDYLLGGTDNFAADREARDEIVSRHPTARLSVWENRWFLHRAVRFMTARGVRQFLDIGSGIPTSPNTHEIAQESDPTARVVYVDNDPLVLVHARALLTGAAGRPTSRPTCASPARSFKLARYSTRSTSPNRSGSC
jgi:hypothetical protein